MISKQEAVSRVSASAGRHGRVESRGVKNSMILGGRVNRSKESAQKARLRARHLVLESYNCIHSHLFPVPVRSTSPDDGVLNTDVDEGI